MYIKQKKGNLKGLPFFVVEFFFYLPIEIFSIFANNMETKSIIFISAAVLLVGGLAVYAVYANTQHGDDVDLETKLEREIRFTRDNELAEQ